MKEMPSRYNPKEVEEKWYAEWLKHGVFNADVDASKKPFCVVIPPPNVTGILHMGHALNNTFQDIIVRYHRMKGESALWMPGTDHAGIATQNVVERDIAKQNLKRQDLGRDKFLERVWQWREQYGSTIINQLKKLGCSCDWRRTRFTMDEEYSKAVREVFVTLWKDGLIYQSDYIINWCPRCQTALADEEAPHQDVEGKLYYIKYPLKKELTTSTARKATRLPEHIVVATTRPETMLGDTAVAVNPKDKRFKNLIGKTVILPLMEREIKIIADDLIDPKFGTGLVKVTPAHDPNDYTMGIRHKLEFINILHPNGVLNEKCGKYSGMDRFDARQLIVKDLEEKQLLEKVENHSHAVGHCYRCHSVVEPYLSKQWFVKMAPLAKQAIKVVKDGTIKFYPERWKKVYLNWMENIRDWCISRQIWWGHRIPVWYCQECGQVIASIETPQQCSKCGSVKLKQDEDVLDTWFSSWLWPFATFYWPSKDEKVKKELSYFYPTNTLVTAPEIIFFWVARMIMAGLYFMKDIPFRDVYIHGTVRDIEGKKMSKSLGNVIDPLGIINEYGCDALRFSLISLVSTGQDVFLSEEKFEKGRNFANKLWNASRFILLNLKDENAEVDPFPFLDKETMNLPQRWIASNLFDTISKVEKAMEKYRFNEAVNLIYEFFWHKFCDWYLEIAKLSIEDKATQVVLYRVLTKTLRILHPFMPFITAEIWSLMPGEKHSLSVDMWANIRPDLIDKKVNAQMQVLIDMVTAVRNLRSTVTIPVKEFITVQVLSTSKAAVKIIEENKAIIERLCLAKEIVFIKGKNERAKGLSAVVSKDIAVTIPLEGLVDIEAEKKRLVAQSEEIKNFIVQKEARLRDKAFLSKAPTQIVMGEKQKCEELKERLAKVSETMNALS